MGELAAQGWADAAIADELSGYFTTTPRFGQRPLAKDTVGAMRRMWFPREFAPGCGHGTIETPSGELVEGRHPAAWPYELWQKMVEAKGGNFHRIASEPARHAREFSRIITCSACERPLRVSGHSHDYHYRDTSRMRQLSCTAFGCLSVSAQRATQQFGTLLASIQLPSSWHEAVLQRCSEIVRDEGTERLLLQRSQVEAEQKRLVLAFSKGYISEEELDIEINRIRAQLLAMPRVPAYHTREEYGRLAIAAGESLSKLASLWTRVTPEERRELVWSLLSLGGLLYDLQRQCIVGLIPRTAVLPAFALGLGEQWELRSQGLWLREEYLDLHAAVSQISLEAPLTRRRRLGADQCQEALRLIQGGMSPQKVAERFHVSYWVIFRLMRHEEPKRTPQQLPKLTSEQEVEAREMLRQGKSLRKVGSHFGVSYMCIWRMVHRDVNECVLGED